MPDSLVSQFRQIAEKARSPHTVYVEASNIPIPSKANVMPVVIPNINTRRGRNVDLHPTVIYITQAFIMHPKKDLVISVRRVNL